MTGTTSRANVADIILIPKSRPTERSPGGMRKTHLKNAFALDNPGPPISKLFFFVLPAIVGLEILALICWFV